MNNENPIFVICLVKVWVLFLLDSSYVSISKSIDWFTSGTTGPPKGVILWHLNLLTAMFGIISLLDSALEPVHDLRDLKNVSGVDRWF
jgi:acyl-CoA synthetase (AMP-forming)/AMP-acid ligase II